ncbi:MAG TPA: iron-sulfur cluster insertion protein ErpA [Lacunisphaera sp.]|nr:iron-sulfur cluster insertion protein ErpA [Lacunisphaera sp.]
MLTLSPRAAQQVRSMHSAQGDERRKLRVFVDAGGCSGFEYGMSFDLPKADDNVYESEGVQILVDPTSLAYLDGTHIDFDDGLQGKGFELRNPNAKSTCGCGRSFS